MTADDYSKAMLASLMWRAANHISFPAMVAVGLCVRNRVKDGNWLPVIDKINAQNVATGIDCTDARDPKFQDVLTAVDGIFDGTRADRWTNGGTQWWSSPGTERTAVVGNLEIYK